MKNCWILRIFKLFREMFGLVLDLQSFWQFLIGTAMGGMILTAIASVGDWFTGQPLIVQIVWYIPCLVFGLVITTYVWKTVKETNVYKRFTDTHKTNFLVECKKERIRPYFQYFNKDDDPGIPYSSQMCRISVQNLSPNDIPNMQVKLINIKPLPKGFGGDHLPMIFMHTRPPHPDSKIFPDSIRLTAGNKEFVDIACLILDEQKRGCALQIETSLTDIQRIIPEQEYELTIQVTGTNTEKVVKRLRIWTDYVVENGGLFMEMIEDQEATKS